MGPFKQACDLVESTLAGKLDGASRGEDGHVALRLHGFVKKVGGHPIEKSEGVASALLGGTQQFPLMFRLEVGEFINQLQVGLAGFDVIFPRGVAIRMRFVFAVKSAENVIDANQIATRATNAGFIDVPAFVIASELNLLNQGELREGLFEFQKATAGVAGLNAHSGRFKRVLACVEFFNAAKSGGIGNSSGFAHDLFCP